MKYIRSLYSMLTIVTVGLILISVPVYAFVDDNRDMTHRDFQGQHHHERHMSGHIGSRSTGLW